MSSSVSRIVSERNHRALLELAMMPGNDVCADCKARAPRWTSYNLGIFICVNCASLHRKLGTHITKVKSLTLDEWTKEQVEVMRENGNIKSNMLYNPNETRHPPPTNMIDSERDSELEKFIRAKYQFKRFMERKPAPQPAAAQPRTVSSSVDPRLPSTPINDAVQIARNTSPAPLPPPKTPQNMPPRLSASATIPSSLSQKAHPPSRSASQPLPTLPGSAKQAAAPAHPQPSATQPSLGKPSGQVWDDLVSLQGPSESSSLPLQYQPQVSLTPTFLSQPLQPHHTLTVSPNPFTNLSIGQANAPTPMVDSPISMTLGQQFPFAASAPLSSPALHLGSTNPFNQVQIMPSAPAPVNGTLFSPSTNPFSQSHGMAATAQPVVTLPTGMMTQQQISQTPFRQTPTPSLPFPSTPGSFTPSLNPMSQNPFFPAVSPQMPMSTGTPNPFSGASMGQTTLQPVFGMTPFASQQQQNPQQNPQQLQFQQQPQQQSLGHANVFGAWAGQGMQRTF